jgi:hypothetical protein
MPHSKSIDDRILPLIQYDFPGNRHALAHGVYRVAAFIGELRDLMTLSVGAAVLMLKK